VRCIYNGGHNWFNGGGRFNGGLVTDFLLQWKKASHIGQGYSKGEDASRSTLLEDIVVYDEDAVAEDPASSPQPRWSVQALTPVAKGHYGDPTKGCLQDEDVVPVGSGHTCAPRIATEPAMTSPPTPRCKLGGVAPSSNGCPSDANIDGSSAWPICLAKGNTSDPYDRGDFHCLLVCPCELGMTADGQCGSEAHAHCPAGSRCERGDLRKRDQGICTYPIRTGDEEASEHSEMFEVVV
jgi:hypothetical protein